MDWGIISAIFFGGLLTELARWYFQDYLRPRMKPVLDKLHSKVDDGKK